MKKDYKAQRLFSKLYKAIKHNKSKKVPQIKKQIKLHFKAKYQEQNKTSIPIKEKQMLVDHLTLD